MNAPPSAGLQLACDVDTVEFSAMGTDWYVEAAGTLRSVIEHTADLVEREEERFSRFRPSSALSRLNEKRASADTELARCLQAAEAFRIDTDGAFDSGVGAAVIAAGYACDFAELALSSPLVDQWSAPAPRPLVESDGQRVALIGAGRVDLGGIAKGWTVDLVARELQLAGAQLWLVDAGGDIAVGGTEPAERLIAVGLTGLTFGLREGAVATSSTMKRVWDTTSGRKHHIIDPRQAAPTSGEFVHATVLARHATAADALATAMLTDPAATTRALSKHQAEVILVRRDGEVYMSPGMGAHLR